MSIGKARQWIERAQKRVHPSSKVLPGCDTWKFLNEALFELKEAETRLARCQQVRDQLSEAVDTLIEERDQYDADLEQEEWEWSRANDEVKRLREERERWLSLAREIREHLKAPLNIERHK
ncbi:MAG: hypothetical protein ACOC6F_02955, partial [bacterium]